MVTREELIDIASSVRESEVDDPHGQCWPASKSLKKELIAQTDATKDEVEIEEVLMGSSATIRHYVVSFPASYVEDVDTYGRVILDITLDQYCTEFEEADKVETSIGARKDIPAVNFYPTKELAPYRG